MRVKKTRVIHVRAATAQFMCGCGHWANRHDSTRLVGACIYCSCQRFKTAPVAPATSLEGDA